MDGKDDFNWKVIIGGAAGVGKTTLIHRYIHKEFMELMKMTVGVQFHNASINRQGRNINLMLWDLGGQERFRFILKSYVSGADGAFVLFDLSRPDTIDQIDEWVNLIRKNNKADIPITLVGTKYDLVDQETLEMVNEVAAEVVARLNLSSFIVTSSKSDYNIMETMEYKVDLLLWQRYQQKPAASNQTVEW